MVTRDNYRQIDLLKYLRQTKDMKEAQMMIDSDILYEPELCALGVNPNITYDILFELAGSKYDSVRSEVARNKLVGEKRLSYILCNDAVGKVRTSLAGNIYTPAGLLGTLSSDYDYYVRQAAFRNPMLPRKYVMNAFESDQNIALAADNPNLTSTDLYTIANKKVTSNNQKDIKAVMACQGIKDAKAVIAKRSDLPMPLFMQLAYSDDIAVRLEIAKNPFCDDETLIYLSGDSDVRIKEALLRRPYLPPEALSNFVLDEDDVIRRLAAKRNNLFLEDQNTLSVDKNRQVRFELLLNDSIDQHLKEQMELRDENQELMININNFR